MICDWAYSKRSPFGSLDLGWGYPFRLIEPLEVAYGSFLIKASSLYLKYIYIKKQNHIPVLHIVKYQTQVIW